ncbi:MAG: rod shape-determining protein MreC [Chthonomonas sp.]|nr:rod shape-determining protein MreC [Chthonomonas sp.]
MPIVCVAVAVFVGTQQNRARKNSATDPVTSVVRQVVAPPSQWLGARLDGLTDFWSGFTSAGTLREEVRRLRGENAHLLLYSDREAELSRRVQNLEQLLGTKSSLAGTKVLARVSGYHVYEDRATLNVGKAQGIVPGAAVVGNAGLLGIVQTVSAKTSQVLLISSSSCRLGAKINTSPPVVGLIKGETSVRLVFETNVTDRPMASGQRVVTNGLSDTIPPGVLIGYVERSESSPEFGASRAKVVPVENLADVREVWVILP